MLHFRNLLASIAMTFLITSEVFPTVVRLTAFGISQLPGKVFLVFYSYVMQIGQDRIPWLSPLCMGTLALASSIASLALPDTRRTTLLPTIKATEEYYRREPSVLAKLLRKEVTRVVPVTNEDCLT